MNKVIITHNSDGLQHSGKKGMKWDEKKKKKKESQNMTQKKQTIFDKLKKSLEQADVFVVTKNNMTLSELLAGTSKVELKGFKKVTTQQESGDGKVQLKGFKKVNTQSESGNKVQLKGFTKK